MSPICQNQIWSVMSLVLTTNLNFSLKFLTFNEIVSSIKILYLDDISTKSLIYMFFQYLNLFLFIYSITMKISFSVVTISEVSYIIESMHFWQTFDKHVTFFVTYSFQRGHHTSRHNMHILEKRYPNFSTEETCYVLIPR